MEKKMGYLKKIITKINQYMKGNIYLEKDMEKEKNIVIRVS